MIPFGSNFKGKYVINKEGSPIITTGGDNSCNKPLLPVKHDEIIDKDNCISAGFFNTGMVEDGKIKVICFSHSSSLMKSSRIEDEIILEKFLNGLFLIK